MDPSLRNTSTLREMHTALFNADGEDVRLNTPCVDWAILRSKKKRSRMMSEGALRETFNRLLERVTAEKKGAW